MIRTLLLISSLLLAQNAIAECETNPGFLGARYVETRSVIEPEKETVRHFAIWRSERQIAHEHSDSHLTELWEKGASERMRLVLYFEEDQRGIEYQPGEEGLESSAEAWYIKSHLIGADMLAGMDKTGDSGHGCDLAEVYEHEKDGQKVRIEWLPAVQLVKTAEWETSQGKTELRLEDTVSDPAQVKAVFARLSDYQTTDFADIGDHESDPFLLKMINLGFTGHDH